MPNEALGTRYARTRGEWSSAGCTGTLVGGTPKSSVERRRKRSTTPYTARDSVASGTRLPAEWDGEGPDWLTLVGDNGAGMEREWHEWVEGAWEVSLWGWPPTNVV
ncbi:hypothetical protein V495_08213 [Pseudogymnoascus sp. VKM F-4514 (FW-929)]|nr:hypothetical protein V490_00775 [Pseudogymnoascus sp. VKM F-3557]KFY34089.1 hypothetical protein V495_08213 [Pseudogymnoascus sp. VKM F-4514 (FW-929)]